VRAHLGDEVSDRVYGQGLTLSADEAFRLTLGKAGAPAGSL
jgi:hypothetical protein